MLIELITSAKDDESDWAENSSKTSTNIPQNFKLVSLVNQASDDNQSNRLTGKKTMTKLAVADRLFHSHSLEQMLFIKSQQNINNMDLSRQEAVK